MGNLAELFVVVLDFTGRLVI